MENIAEMGEVGGMEEAHMGVTEGEHHWCQWCREGTINDRYQQC